MMKSKIILFVLLMAIISPVVFPQESSFWGRIPENIKDRKVFKRFAWYYQQRAYPYDKIPGTRYRQEMSREIWKSKQISTRNGNECEWHSIGPGGVLFDRFFPWGLASGRIRAIAVHPTDTNTVYVASMGHTHGPQQERGVYKTVDGGKTWERIFFVNENTGCSDFSIDPKNPEVLYAAMWQVDIRTWNLSSGGEGSGIYRSKDGGKTWEPLRNGLESGPNHPVGKTSVDVSYTNPDQLFLKKRLHAYTAFVWLCDVLHDLPQEVTG